jgi:hypothetical protein
MEGLINHLTETTVVLIDRNQKMMEELTAPQKEVILVMAAADFKGPIITMAEPLNNRSVNPNRKEDMSLRRNNNPSGSLKEGRTEVAVHLTEVLKDLLNLNVGMSLRHSSNRADK